VVTGDVPATARRWLVRLLWIVGMMVAAVALGNALPELRQGIDTLGEAHRGLLAAAVMVEIVALATLPFTLRGALAMFGGHVRYCIALDATVGAFALSRVVPGGGLAGGVYATRRFVRAGSTVAVSSATWRPSSASPSTGTHPWCSQAVTPSPR
jgi:hypothetical protein